MSMAKASGLAAALACLSGLAMDINACILYRFRSAQRPAQRVQVAPRECNPVVVASSTPPPPTVIVDPGGAEPSTANTDPGGAGPSNVDTGTGGAGSSTPRRRQNTSGQSRIAPAAPKADDAPIAPPATVSHLSLAATFPKAAIQAQLESAIPKSFPFDEDKDFHTYGNPSRGAIAVAINPTSRRLSASTEVKGRVQVEKRIIVDIPFVGRREIGRPSVGIDVAGGISASVSPVIGPKWDVNPQLSLSASLNRAAAKTPFGDVDITGLVRGKIGGVLNGARGPIEAKLRQVLNLRSRSERLWNQIASVQKLSDSPTTWMQIIPRQARVAQFQYTPNAILAGLGLDLETRVFVQDKAPPVVKTLLSDLQIGGNPSDAFDLSLPVEVSHEAINQQLRAQLMKGPISLPDDASVTITDARISSHKTGIMLALDFRAEQGAAKSASGRLYVTGDAVINSATDELRLRNLAFTADTKEALNQNADWLGQADPLRPMSGAVVIKLGDALAQAKKGANEQLATLKTRLTKEFAVNLAVTDLHISRLAFARDRTFAVITARGKMSAVLNP